jgi:hypothetical protein
MGLILPTMLTMAGSTAARTQGVTGPGILHWAGELLLVLGVILAAKGISDVRREWTSRPGIWGRTREVARPRIGLARARWYRFVGRSRLAQRLHLHLYRGKPVAGSGSVPMSKMGMTGSGTVGIGSPLTGGTVEERLAWLENRITATWDQVTDLSLSRQQEIKDREAAVEAECAARVAEDERIRGDIANYAGGGLRLQTWGVVCLLAGTVLTAFW